jgi:membrane protein implicated in regulation of membrane protease activity
MPKNRIIIALGVIIALLPVLGFPKQWESVFQVIAGLSIVLLSIWTHVDRRLSHKAKARTRQGRRRTDPIVVIEEAVLADDTLEENQTN